MSYDKPTVKTVHYHALIESLPSLAGKTIAITGTTSGTGKAASRAVAQLGGRLLMLNRASSRSEKALAEITEAFPDAEIHAVECDLQSFASVEAASRAVAKLCPEGLHVLCNNAGVMALKDEATGDGFDVQMQTNHLSHFLLTREVWPLLVKAAKTTGEARIIQHSSVARKQPSKKLKPEYLEARGGNLGGNSSSMLGGARWKRYNQSKLANCAFAAALKARIDEAGLPIKSLLAHPGLAATELQSTSVSEGGMGKWFTKQFMKMAQSFEDGSLGILSGIAHPEARSGQFWGPGSGNFSMKGKAKPFDFERFYDNPDTRDLLWTQSEEAIGRSFTIGEG